MILHCTKCMHEWQSTDKNSKCDWCGADGKVIGKSWDDEALEHYPIVFPTCPPKVNPL